MRRRRRIRVDGAEVLETGLQIADGEDDDSQDFPLPPPQDPPTRPGSSTPLVEGRVDRADAIREKLRTSEQAPAPTTPSFPRGSADLPPSAAPARRTRRLKNHRASRSPTPSHPRKAEATAADQSPVKRQRPQLRRVWIGDGLRRQPSPVGDRRRPLVRPIVASFALLAVIGVAVAVIVGLGATGTPLLTRGHPPGAPHRSLVASTPQIAAEAAQDVRDQRHAMSLTIERIASEQQADERRKAEARARRRKAEARVERQQARARAERRKRAKTHVAPPATDTVYAPAARSSTAASSSPSVSSPVSSTETSSVQSPAPTTYSAPASTTPAPSPVSSSNGSTKQSSTSTKQPAFGSSGTLGPGSSPDG